MDKRERFFRTIEREQVDRPCWWLGMPTVEAMPQLLKYFGVNNYRDLKLKLDDDIWSFDMPYENGTTNAVSMAFDFAKKNQNFSYNERTLTTPGFFEDYEDEEDFEKFNRWPDPEKYIHKESCLRELKKVPDGMPVLGVLWSAHFQDACSAFGMQDALIKMKIAPELFKKVINRIVEFYLRANEIFYEYTKGKVDAVLLGNDFGTQTSLLVGRDDLREFVFEGTKKLIAQAHAYGLKVIHHSCGAISEIIPDLIGCGVDVIHPIQALATGMEAEVLKEKFASKVSFAGGVDAQYLLVNGSPSEVENKVFNLCELFPTGLIISPSHEAILLDIPPANIESIALAMRKIKKH